MSIYLDQDYYAARADRERAMAANATDPRAAAIHREMADRYARLAVTIIPDCTMIEIVAS